MKTFKKIIIIALCVILGLINIALDVRIVGKVINSRTPKGGINKSLYVDINGTKQWINIYGKDKNNPVLLYLHGGPGSATSYVDYEFTRKWSDVYTVVTWDQRAAGKSWLKNTKDTTPINLDTMMEDGLEMTEFLRSHLGKDKISIIGHSWGSIYGAMLVHDHPEYYDCFIGTGMTVDLIENEIRFWEAAKEWAKGNEEDEQLIEKCASGEIPNMSVEYIKVRTEMMNKYGYGMDSEKSDYSMIAALFFNPYYNLWDEIKCLKFATTQGAAETYYDWDATEEFKGLSILDETEYKVPYYNINGDMDYQANFELAQDYFDSVKAPRKKMYYMKNMAHGLMEVRSGEFSDIVHEIAAMESNK
ncbi:alpha/beta fold hydrolase [Butyrivibrio sp. INlla21]|uniref:alpha/beta fold hydrolase n=1 Tax=Butyrivibrio sp. INlla21 TaxID=1520811 RepID=UPI0008ED832C|nr:alpha/beta fold hydrolase [Butyrivibrio sp. INlla21]SFV01496.1 Pimeloyl-ACP methyl ester carboxylesterase [Butyrivibrio sp. INlla21]